MVGAIILGMQTVLDQVDAESQEPHIEEQAAIGQAFSTTNLPGNTTGRPRASMSSNCFGHDCGVRLGGCLRLRAIFAGRIWTTIWTNCGKGLSVVMLCGDLSP
jgi:hypothetical protein